MGEVPSQAVETGEEPLNLSGAPAPVSEPGKRGLLRAEPPGSQHALLRRLLACADLGAAFLASLSLAVVGDGDVGQLAWALAFLPVWVVLAKLLGLYDRDGRSLRHLTVEEAPLLVLWALIGIACVALFLDLMPAGRPDASGAIVAVAVAAVSVIALRALARYVWRRVTPPTRLALIGSIGSADILRRKLELFPDVHAEIVSVHNPREIDRLARDPETLAGIDRLGFAPASLDGEQVHAVREIARSAGVDLSVMPPSPSMFGSPARLDHLAEVPLLEYSTGVLSRSTLFLKRALDAVVSSLALVLLSPLLACTAVAIKLDSPGPVLFTQWRAGQDGKRFRIRKFRTMVWNAEELLPQLVRFDELAEPVFKIADDPRVTRVGRVLRRWSLDELPQLLNVLKGEMSLVGPRPEQLELVERYTHEHRLRLAVKPGLTGPMQVYGRGDLSMDERLAVEYDYIENMSIGRDLHLLGQTAAAVVRGKGAF
jgi:exopolysaccharide biosynthesis polyprenyl glycosylphosphotransferase